MLLVFPVLDTQIRINDDEPYFLEHPGFGGQYNNEENIEWMFRTDPDKVREDINLR